MAINGFAHRPADTADDLDVPDFLKPDFTPTKTVRTIPGEVIHNEPPSTAADDDDLAPGTIEVRPYRAPVLRRAGSAAMTVAATTGRAIGLTARTVHTGWGALRPFWIPARYFGVGLGATCHLGYRYVRAHDLQEAMGGVGSKTEFAAVKAERRERWKTAGWTAAGTTALNVTAWWALVKYAGLTALDWSWAVAPGVEALAAGAALTVYGRYRLEYQLAPQEIAAAEDLDADPDEPFPLAWCQDGKQAAECLARALAAEGADYRSMNTLARHSWGWEIEVVLKGSTPGKVMSAADQIESHLGLPDGGFMMEPDSRDKSRIVVRLVQSNPFADMPAPAAHAPRSLSVHDTIAMGRVMDGATFQLTLDGFCALIIGAMGAGKTLGALRTIAEALTACRDAVCWDLDPLKGGLGEFGDLMEVSARGPEECEEALEQALAYVPARSKVMPRIGMGDRWYATEKHPDLYVFIDEYLQLSPRGKDLAIKILRTGRQYGIYLIMAGQEATADSLGDAIAGVVPYRILMACRFEDVKIAFGPGKGAQGWRPDRMEPAVGKVRNDAGQSYIMGGGFVRAIRHQFNAYSRDQIVSAVPARLAAGANRMDADTLLEAGQGLASSGQRVGLVDRLDALGTPDARTVAGLLRLFDGHAASFLPTAVIVDAGIAPDGVELQTLLARLVPMAKSAKPTIDGKQVRGWERAVAEKAAAALFAPS